jgi:hypothetical protein
VRSDGFAHVAMRRADEKSIAANGKIPHNKQLCGMCGSEWTLTDAAFDAEAGIWFYLFDLSLCLLVRFCVMGTFMDTKNA